MLLNIGPEAAAKVRARFKCRCAGFFFITDDAVFRGMNDKCSCSKNTKGFLYISAVFLYAKKLSF